MIIFFSILAILLMVVAAYAFRCIHYWQRDCRATQRVGFREKQTVLPDGSMIHYAEGPDNGPALLLIHGQTGAWQDYASVLPKLGKRWHAFAVDVYGHGKSTHDEAKYTLPKQGDDLLWFINHIIGGATVVSGHSSGGLIAAYVVAYGGENIKGAVLEDPPVFSTEPGAFEKTFAYLDTYTVMHEYRQTDRKECWVSFYLRNCLWGKLFMAKAMPGLARYAQRYSVRHPDRPVQFFFMPQSINQMFLYVREYDFAFGEHFYDFTWHAGIPHERLMSAIRVPTVFLHAKDAYSPDGNILMAASSDAQARKAVALMQNAKLVELKSNHDIHRDHPSVFIDALNSLYAAATAR